MNRLLKRFSIGKIGGSININKININPIDPDQNTNNAAIIESFFQDTISSENLEEIKIATPPCLLIAGDQSARLGINMHIGGNQCLLNKAQVTIRFFNKIKEKIIVKGIPQTPRINS